ncbi:MAG TPA: dephospho-CoA kinase, partial [Methanocorpusculum sp.]|nr:dephospho-CoA kinase [Methanocorpusculum sp.]
MLIGITGTPGTGKTSVAEALRKRGIDVLDLKTTVAPYVLEHDDEMGADIVDVE